METCSYLSDRLFSNRHNSLPGEAPLIRTLMNQIEVEMAPSDQVDNFRAVIGCNLFLSVD